MKKRNPNDSTLRNVKAANTKIADLSRRVLTLERAVKRLTAVVARLK